MVNPRVVWFVDENKSELRTYCRVLQRAMPAHVRVEARLPYRTMEEYLPILGDPSTFCIIIDQRLKNTGIAGYTGIELAEYMRSADTKMPIYILTNYKDEPDEFTGGEWSVEDIIGKDELGDEQQLMVVMARMLRRIDVYEDVLSDREQRFRRLLRKALSDELGEEEMAELEELQLARTSVILTDELRRLYDLEDVIAKHKDLLDDLSRLSAGEDDDGG